MPLNFAKIDFKGGLSNINIKTEPIRSKDVLEAIGGYLKGKRFRDYAIFKTQLNTALRISDVVKLKYDDVFFNKKIKKYIELIEKKTGKPKKILINKELNIVFNDLVNTYKLSQGDYLFQSQKGNNRPLTTTQVHRIYQQVAKVFNLDKFNSHSLRKTFCFFVYKKTKDIALIMTLLNHSSEAITMRYIGIADADLDKLYSDFNF